MKNILLTGLILFLLAGGPVRLFAQDELYDAVYINLTKEYTLNPDGSTDYRLIKDLKLQSYRSFHNLYGETFVVYNPQAQKLTVGEDWTLMADGKKVVAPENAFNEVLPSYAASAPSYNNLREMVITHTGLERNATIHLDYTIHTEKGHLPALMGNELLAEAEPVKSLVVRVRIPAGQNLYYRSFNGDYKPEKSSEGGFTVFTWKLADMKAISVEENQQGLNELYPRLVFSTSDRPEADYGFFSGQPAFTAPLPDEINTAVSRWMEKGGSKFERALTLQEKVVNEIRLYPVPLRVALYAGRTPGETWNENGGTAIEKALLLAAMMRSAGIEAQPVAVVRAAFSDEKTGTLADIEDVAVRADFKDYGSWYFSVTALNPVNLKLSLPGRSFIPLKTGSDAVKAGEPKQMVRVIGNFLVSSDPKLTGEVSIYMDGSAYPSAGMVRDKKRMKNALSGNLIGNDTANLKSNILNPENGSQSWIVKSDRPFRQDSNFWSFNLPVMNSGIESWGIHTLSAKRATPYEIPSAAEESYSYTLALPDGFSCFTPEKKVNIGNKAGTFTWEVKIDGNRLTVKKQVKFSARQFPVSEYPDLKALFDAWNNPWYRQIVLKK